MATFIVRCVDRKTGREFDQDVEAPTPGAAAESVAGNGVMVGRVTLKPAPLTPADVEPILAQLKAVAASLRSIEELPRLIDAARRLRRTVAVGVFFGLAAWALFCLLLWMAMRSLGLA